MTYSYTRRDTADQTTNTSTCPLRTRACNTGKLAGGVDSWCETSLPVMEKSVGWQGQRRRCAAASRRRRQPWWVQTADTAFIVPLSLTTTPSTGPLEKRTAFPTGTSTTAATARQVP